MAAKVTSWKRARVLDDHFPEAIAAHYDETIGTHADAAVITETVDFLAELAEANGGDALELAIGTGRVALPLAARGVRVVGIDLSDAMVARLRAKPGGADLDVARGDFTTTTVDGDFGLVYLVFNTIGNVTTQDQQVATFANAAPHLRPGGCFVVEVGVPQLRRYPPGETMRPFEVTPAHLGFDEIDVATQGLISHHHWLVDGEWQVASMPFRYVWPAELDLMARLAGMTLRERWSGWTREPFTSASTSHVSVWEKAATT